MLDWWHWHNIDHRLGAVAAVRVESAMESQCAVECKATVTLILVFEAEVLLEGAKGTVDPVAFLV